MAIRSTSRFVNCTLSRHTSAPGHDLFRRTYRDHVLVTRSS
jgi:hypothetical protein